MKSRGYTVLGFLAWQGAKLWMRNNRAKLGAGAVVAGVLVAGALAAKLASHDED